MPPKVKVTTNNDIAYIWWSVPKKIVGCLGFSIHREIEGEAPTPLPAWVGFGVSGEPGQVCATRVIVFTTENTRLRLRLRRGKRRTQRSVR